MIIQMTIQECQTRKSTILKMVDEIVTMLRYLQLLLSYLVISFIFYLFFMSMSTQFEDDFGMYFCQYRSLSVLDGGIKSLPSATV